MKGVLAYDAITVKRGSCCTFGGESAAMHSGDNENISIGKSVPIVNAQEKSMTLSLTKRGKLLLESFCSIQMLKQ